MSTPPLPKLKGLFDRPILKSYGQITSKVASIPVAQSNQADGYFLSSNPCESGFTLSIGGHQCLPLFGQAANGGNGPTYPGSTTTTPGSSGPITVNVNNTVNVPKAAVQDLTDAITKSITQTNADLQDKIDKTSNTVIGEIQEDTDSINAGIQAATTNLGNDVTITTTAISAAAAASGVAISSGSNALLDSIKTTVSGAISSITNVIDSINKEVQSINDTLIQPIANLYNGTVGIISSLTVAIEQDLKDGITGLLQIPGQLASELASEDALLNRTVQQLGTQNIETIISGIKFEGDLLPGKYGAEYQKILSGLPRDTGISTTFKAQADLSAETLAGVAQEAIQGLGALFSQLLGTLGDSFGSSFDVISNDWTGAQSVFVPLLNGLLTLLTTITSMGALAAPLIDVAEQEARKLAPTRKLDPATIIEAMRREFVTTSDGLTELATYGFDSTRSKVLQDLSVFLADVNQALDWWYRGIISDEDFAANMNDHGIMPEDQTAIKEGSVNLPDVASLTRWLNFGIITPDQFAAIMKSRRYDESFVSSYLATYQEHESPQTLSQLDGLLESSNAGWLRTVFGSTVPQSVQLAAQRAGMHPDLLRYVWLSHYNIPEVNAFIQLYFRGVRTLTELQQRFQVANIPPELWDDLIQVNRALIPYRSIPSFVKAGLMTNVQAQKELASHGFDLEHQQIILSSLKPPATTATATAAANIHTLSQSNAKQLWESGAITDDQYTAILVAHGYTAEMAALQLKSDQVAEHIKEQKTMLSDLTAQVQTGAMTIDDATALLTKNGFTSAQISKFSVAINKAAKVNVKIPSIAEMLKFVKDGLITVDQFTSAIQQLGWQEPWLSVYVQLANDNLKPTA